MYNCWDSFSGHPVINISKETSSVVYFLINIWGWLLASSSSVGWTVLPSSQLVLCVTSPAEERLLMESTRKRIPCLSQSPPCVILFHIPPAAGIRGCYLKSKTKQKPFCACSYMGYPVMKFRKIVFTINPDCLPNSCRKCRPALPTLTHRVLFLFYEDFLWYTGASVL